MKKRSQGKARRPGGSRTVSVFALSPQEDSIYHLYSVAFGARRARRGNKEIAKQSFLLLVWFAALTGLCATFSSGKLSEAGIVPPVTASAHQTLRMAEHSDRLSL